VSGRRVATLRAVAGAVVLLALGAPRLPAQSGGLFLLVPFGARAVAQGQAAVADSGLGSEGIWWNAAALARMREKEVAVHHSQTVIATSDMLTLVLPSRVLGTVAASAYLVNYGDQPVTDGLSGVVLGNITNRAYTLAASYATPIGSRVSAGLTYKFVMLRFQCSGACGEVPTLSGSSSALDAGVQYRLHGRLPVVAGVSVRNIGPALQIRDREQADPLPRVVQVGLRSRVPIRALAAEGAALHVMGDLLQTTALDGLVVGLGAELAYRDQFFLRSGYLRQPASGSSGPSIGVGASRGALSLEIARRFDELSAQLGDTPTYVALRVRF
jgi:hypothetical protein